MVDRDDPRAHASFQGAVSSPPVDDLHLSLPDEAATRRLGDALAGALRAGDLVILEGDLGAGKTCLVRAVARALGVPEDVPVTSPTFGLVHEVPSAPPILHADLFRLEDPAELVEIGLLHRIGGEAIVVVEWGERFADALGSVDIVVVMAFEADTARRATFGARTTRGREIVREVGARLAAFGPL